MPYGILSSAVNIMNLVGEGGGGCPNGMVMVEINSCKKKTEF
jgi:hypothetical protein